MNAVPNDEILINFNNQFFNEDPDLYGEYLKKIIGHIKKKCLLRLNIKKNLETIDSILNNNIRQTNYDEYDIQITSLYIQIIYLFLISFQKLNFFLCNNDNERYCSILHKKLMEFIKINKNYYPNFQFDENFNNVVELINNILQGLFDFDITKLRQEYYNDIKKLFDNFDDI